MERVLIVCSREICYRSSNFFAHQIGAAYEEAGFRADICELSEEDDMDAVLEPLLGKPYRLILDFNSKLPHFEMEDGVPYLDRLCGPFFDYLVDHPLFHHNALMTKAKNMHALVLDEGQRDYVKACYPQVCSVDMLPLGATQALYEGEKANECRILFPGTYDSPEGIYEIVKASPEPFCGLMKQVIERRTAEPLLSMERAFAQVLEEIGMELSAERFALFMNAMYASDAFIRDYFRKKALDALLRRRLPVTVMGEGWEKYRYADESSLKRERAVPFGLSFERIAKEHILLNVSPIFNRGMHDRIPAGMANHTVVLTEQNPWVETHFAVGEELACYDLAELSSLGELAGELVESPGRRQRMAEAAYRKFLACHSWACRAQEILALADALPRDVTGGTR